MIFAGLGSNFALGSGFFPWGCDFQDNICLGKPILTNFLLGVLHGVDLLGAVRHGYCNSVIDRNQQYKLLILICGPGSLEHLNFSNWPRKNIAAFPQLRKIPMLPSSFGWWGRVTWSFALVLIIQSFDNLGESASNSIGICCCWITVNGHFSWWVVFFRSSF